MNVKSIRCWASRLAASCALAAGLAHCTVPTAHELHISGVIADIETGAPLEGATVVVLDSSVSQSPMALPVHREIGRTVTRKDGTYETAVPMQNGLLVDVLSAPCKNKGNGRAVGEPRRVGIGFQARADLSVRADECPAPDSGSAPPAAITPEEFASLESAAMNGDVAAIHRLQEYFLALDDHHRASIWFDHGVDVEDSTSMLRKAIQLSSRNAGDCRAAQALIRAVRQLPLDAEARGLLEGAEHVYREGCATP
ncbi:hypothetical protein [Arenimonas composti]|uniref:hypothetical protein n=1 Tax=Arenimonas composti TaxID=370776 RepID=UPI0012B62C9F|nr:hypothetical protein [Arenimonas composti]